MLDPESLLEDEILNRKRKPSPSPSYVLKFSVVLYGTAALGYAAFHLVVAFFAWAASRHVVFGVVGVLGLFLIGPGLVWVHSTQRRLFASLELLASVSGVFHYSLKLASASYDLGVLVSLTGAAFLFVKGFKDYREGRN